MVSSYGYVQLSRLENVVAFKCIMMQACASNVFRYADSRTNYLVAIVFLGHIMIALYI